MPLELTIDGRPVQVAEGTSLLAAAAAAGIEVPTLCHHPSLEPVGSCRLCLVEVEGVPHLQPACMTPVTNGLIVRTATAALHAQRRMVLEMLLIDYHHDPAAEGGPETTFDRWCREYGAVRPADSPASLRHARDDDPNPFIRVDLNRCILCTQCVRVCEDVQGRFVWGVAGRGREATVTPGTGTMMLEARCESCGACSDCCPSGALEDRLSFGRGVPDRLVRTTCGYCGVGCQFDLNVKEERIIGVSPAVDAPVNGVSLCVKGRYGFDFIHHADRLTRPLVREHLLNDPFARRAAGQARGGWVPVSWDRALDLVADRLSRIRSESGPDAIGLLSSAKCSNEENYLMQKLARQMIGTNNIDHCARLCHSSTVAGLSMAFGSGAMSNSMDDVVEQARAMFIIGSNTTEQHPVFGAMIRQAVRQRGVKLVVADPRRIDIAEFAAIHLRHKPGTDIPLLNGLMYLILHDGREDHTFIEGRCEGFEAFRDSLASYDPETVSRMTEVPVAQLEVAAELLATHHPMAVIWAMGITQHTTGVLNVLALANLQMLLGNMGIPGGGVNPLRGQNNVQGACDMGALPNVLPGYQSVADPDVRRKFSVAWELCPLQMTNDEIPNPGAPGFVTRNSSFPASPGLTVTEMIDSAGRGDLRGLFILGENPALTDPDSNHVRDCLERAELVVLQEIFPSETSHYADVLLPGASFAERSGTFTNTERRVQLFRQAISPIGEARADWSVIADLGRRLLQRQSWTPHGPHAGWDYASPAEILAEVAAVTPSYGGVSHERLERGARLQWPVPDEHHPGTPILHVGEFARGRGRFHVVEHLPPQESPDAEFPLLLTTGRVLYHWHGGEMTRRARGLAAVYPETLVEISPDDARARGIADGDAIELRSRRGVMQGRALVTPRIAPGVVFGNFHFPDGFNVNNLTIAALDPVAKIPEYKVCAVALSRRT